MRRFALWAVAAVGAVLAPATPGVQRARPAPRSPSFQRRYTGLVDEAGG